MNKCQKYLIFEHFQKNRRFFSKKAQGLSITTVIVAILAILVLVVLFFVFTGRMGQFGVGVSDCPTNVCKDTQTECTDQGMVPLGGTDCGENRYCCVAEGVVPKKA